MFSYNKIASSSVSVVLLAHQFIDGLTYSEAATILRVLHALPPISTMVTLQANFMSLGGLAASAYGVCVHTDHDLILKP